MAYKALRIRPSDREHSICANMKEEKESEEDEEESKKKTCSAFILFPWAKLLLLGATCTPDQK